MKHIGLFFVVVSAIAGALLAGCGRSQQPEGEVVARINAYNMTAEDFLEEVEYSDYGIDFTTAPERVLEVAIDRQLLIQEAQRRGLDRQKTFLKTIERYWEQTLIKELMDQEAARIAESSAPAMREESLQRWIESLRSEAAISINRPFLEKLIEQQKENKK